MLTWIGCNLHTEQTGKYTYTTKANNMNQKPEQMKEIGLWRWNSELVLSKVDRRGQDECWPWLGAQSPSAPLFGARKNNRPQMSQAARILYREYFNEDCEDFEITHSCGNKNCMNPNHWFVKQENKCGRKPKPQVKIKSATLKPIKQPVIKPAKKETKPKKKQWWPK